MSDGTRPILARLLLMMVRGRLSGANEPIPPKGVHCRTWATPWCRPCRSREREIRHHRGMTMDEDKDAWLDEVKQWVFGDQLPTHMRAVPARGDASDAVLPPVPLAQPLEQPARTP